MSVKMLELRFPGPPIDAAARNLLALNETLYIILVRTVMVQHANHNGDHMSGHHRQYWRVHEQEDDLDPTAIQIQLMFHVYSSRNSLRKL